MYSHGRAGSDGNSAGADERLVTQAVLAGDNPFNDFDHRSMYLGCLRDRGRFLVCGGDIAEHVAHRNLAHDIEVGQRKEERLADAKGSHSCCTVYLCLLGHLLPFDREPIAARPCRG